MKARITALLVGLFVVAGVTPALGNGGWEMVAGGLDNPRGIAIGTDGSIYVAESGSGGSELVSAVFEGEEVFGCKGDTGAVARIDKKGNVKRLGSLPSLGGATYDEENDEWLCGAGPEEGFAATGPSNVSALGNGTLAVTMGLGGDFGIQQDLGGIFGELLAVKPNGKYTVVANLAGHESSDPAGDGEDSNPYGLAALGGGKRLVADAGGNTLLMVSANGTVETVAVFPPLGPVPFDTPSCLEGIPDLPLPPDGTEIPPQAVPTAVAVGPDGAYYVGILSGFPFGLGAAKVYRVDPNTGDVSVFVDGLNHVTGIDFGPDGALYVAQITDAPLLEAEICGDETPGSVLRITNGGTDEEVRETLGMFPLPGDVAVARDGTVYVTILSIIPAALGGGAVMRLTP